MMDGPEGLLPAPESHWWQSIEPQQRPMVQALTSARLRPVDLVRPLVADGWMEFSASANAFNGRTVRPRTPRHDSPPQKPSPTSISPSQWRFSPHEECIAMYYSPVPSASSLVQREAIQSPTATSRGEGRRAQASLRPVTEPLAYPIRLEPLAPRLPRRANTA
jgi:hypothetical protein